jgi:NADH-quinone oxidoreductase subunit H
MNMAATLLLLQRLQDPQAPVQGAPWLWFTIVKLLAVFTVIMVGVAYLTLAERKISAWIQDRLGPNRAGPRGLLQPAADGLKNIMKEETYPAAAYKPIFILAPIMSFIPALITFAVIPFAAPWPTRWGLVDMVIANAPIGFLYILAIASLGVYGIVLAGWSSNNKYSLLGGIRSSAQMVSYEVALALAIIPVLLLAGNVSLDSIVQQQVVSGWNAFPLLVGFFLFMVAAFAETNRLPFDLPEAESELITGFHTEYSSMKFSMFFIAEYSNMITASALTVTLFFGGWSVPFWTAVNTAPWAWWKSLITLGAFVVKVLFFLFLFMWVRWTLPRFRYDQLMSLGWKIMIPMGLGYVVVMASAILGLSALGISPTERWLGFVPVYWAILGVLNIVLAALVFVVLDRGRIVSPAYSPIRKAELARLQARTIPRTLSPAEGD